MGADLHGTRPSLHERAGTLLVSGICISYIPGTGALPDICARLPRGAWRPRVSAYGIYQAKHECLGYS